MALLIWSEPAAWVVLGLVLIVAVLLGLVELIGRPPSAGDEPGTETQAESVDVDGPLSTAREDKSRPAGAGQEAQGSGN